MLKTKYFMHVIEIRIKDSQDLSSFCDETVEFKFHLNIYKFLNEEIRIRIHVRYPVFITESIDCDLRFHYKLCL